MSKDISKSRAAIAEEAAEWFIDWREALPSRADKSRFADWISESPVHVEEYLAIAQIYGALSQVDPSSIADVDAFVDDTVVALHGKTPSDPTLAPLVSPRRQRVRWWGIAAGVMVATAALVYTQSNQDPTVEYTTELGEQRSVLLDDGSMVSLNTQSRIEVAYSESERLVRLTAGEALFDVEKDVNRPFLTETATAVIRVTGTQFNVYQRDGGTAVTVIEGTVEVAPRASPHAPSLRPASEALLGSGEVAKLWVGDQAVVRSGSIEIEETRIDNLEPVTAWTDRRMVFSETPLSDIVDEFNRYNRQRLVLDDATIAGLELSAVFSTHDPESLILFLERIPEVRVEIAGDGSAIHVRAARNAPRSSESQ